MYSQCTRKVKVFHKRTVYLLKYNVLQYSTNKICLLNTQSPLREKDKKVPSTKVSEYFARKH